MAIKRVIRIRMNKNYYENEMTVHAAIETTLFR